MPSTTNETPTDEPPIASDVVTDSEADDVDEERPLEDLSLLEDKTPDWFKTTYRVPLAVFLVGLVFLVFSYAKLWHTDVWGHAAYGEWIVEHGRLPATEPLLPLAEGQPFVDTAWGSKIATYAILESVGYSGLQFVNGFGVAAAIGMLLCWITYRTGSFAWGLLAAALFLTVGWEHLSVLRPQLVGVVFFTALLVLLDASPKRWHLYAVPVAFVLWANLHGSFVVGLLLLAAFALGRAVDVLVRTGSFRRLLKDRRVVHTFVLLELAGVATLLNPWGLGLHLEALSFATNPNLAAIVEWEPLTIRMLQARLALYVLVVTFLVHRFSPRRVKSAELLLLIGLGMASVWTSRFVLWWGIVAAWSTALHAAALWSARRGTLPVAEHAEAGGKWTVVAIGWAWIVFAITPLGYQTIHGEKPDARHQRRQLGAMTPVELTTFLQEEPPQGLVYSSLEWGDYLQWAGPDGIQVFVNSHSPVVPREVWDDFLRISAGAHGWDDLLSRYGVNTVVLARGDRPELEGLLGHHDEWTLAYEDHAGSVFERRRPILNDSASLAATNSDVEETP